MKKHHESLRGFPRWLCRLLLSVNVVLVAVSFSFAQQNTDRVTLNMKNASLSEVFNEIKRQTHLSFMFSNDDLKDIKRKDVQMKNVTVDEAMKKCLEGTGLEYELTNNVVVIRKSAAKMEKAQQVTLSGTVRDKDGQTLPGVSVVIKGTSLGGATDIDGKYRFTVPLTKDMILVFSFVGMETKEVVYKGESTLNVTLNSDITEMAEVVVTGIFTRKADSYTGAVTTIKKEELQRVGNQNVLQSLKNIDPSFQVLENNEFGSDPNKVPDIQMRGASNFSDMKDKYQTNPNQPLFIVDGFEQSIEKVMDMDMNRVASITLLKDATAKALYGSKGANGVVVIETVTPEVGKMRVSYSGNLSIQAPDLGSYDLANAAEKLEIERRAGVYTDKLGRPDVQQQYDEKYNEYYKEILRGVDTYWLEKPLRVGVGHKHSLNFEGGDDIIRYSIDFSYNKVAGVMKGSDREVISGGFNFQYRYGKFLFRDQLSVTFNKADESPYGAFSEYAKLNPYWRAYNDDGSIREVMGDYQIANMQGSHPIYNPMINASLNTKTSTSYTDITNNFYAEWQVDKNWKATARIGVSEKRNDMDDFYPASHSIFANVNDILKRGKYIIENGKSSSISGDLNINYNNQFGKHTIFGNAGAFISGEKSSAYRHTAEGFPNNQKADISFAKQYAENSTPTGYSTINREASFLLAASYDYDNRYLADATVRESASSLYGSDNRWANSWSFGIGWNLHNEAILKGVGWIKQLKLRASIGLTGNQNFDTNAAIATYNYYTGIVYGGLAGKFTGAYLASMPNSQLKWEQKKDHNIGIDMRVAGLSLSVDYYSADTKNMLTDVTIPTSTGFAIVKDNLGLVRNSGVEAKANYTIWQGKEGFVNVYGTFAYNRNKIIRLSESMRAYNEKMMKQAEDNNTSAPVLMYQDGLSMKTIWAVPSAGIDPQTGQEIYIKKDGTYTYTYSANDMVAAGNSDPKYRGTGGFTAEYKGIGLSATISYLAGCQMYNSTLVSRVENANIAYNVDRRLLIGRWTTPGQVTPYKKFNSETTTRATTRFVQDRRELSLSSISAYYEFPSSIYKKLSMQRLRLSFYLNDIATFSSIKIERGLNYPFARNMSFSLTATL